MEIQLQEIIDQIKKDGVEAAQNEAESIIDDAKVKAEAIVQDAQNRADEILAKAKAENERMVRSSEDAIRQAGRNLLISFRESVARELKAVLRENVDAVYSSDELSNIIIKVIESWAEKPDAEKIEVILNNEGLAALEKVLLSGISDRLTKGVTLKASDNFDGGFRISVNEGGAYYDYSAETVVEMLSNYLNPKITALMKEAE